MISITQQGRFAGFGLYFQLLLLLRRWYKVVVVRAWMSFEENVSEILMRYKSN